MVKQVIYKTLIPSLTTELMSKKRVWAEEQSVGIFAKNIFDLLMASPLPNQRILAIDPAFRSGCKLVCLNEQGDYCIMKPSIPILLSAILRKR